MHIGAVLIFEGPPLELEQYLDHVPVAGCTSCRANRQKLATPPLETGRPAFGSMTKASISSTNVRHAALCRRPGPREQLFLLAARIRVPSSSTARSRCGRAGLVEGLEGDRFALIFKTHHSLVDGVLRRGPRDGLVRTCPQTPSRRRRTSSRGDRRNEPSPVELIVAGVRGMVNTNRRDRGGGALGAATRAGDVIRAVCETRRRGSARLFGPGSTQRLRPP